MFSEKFHVAFRFAFEAHGKQKRKGTETPYIAHPMAVASLVIEHGGSEAVAIAALLHDVVEDTKVTAAEVESTFGSEVAVLVAAVTSPPVNWKKDYGTDEKIQEALNAFRTKYFEKIRGASSDIQTLSACDKLHNARGILEDLRNARDNVGEGKKPEEVAQLVMTVWNRFRGKRGNTIWYYSNISKVYSESESPTVRQLGRSLARVVEDMEKDF